MLGEDDEQLSWFPSASNSRRSVQVRYPMINDFSVTEGGTMGRDQKKVHLKERLTLTLVNANLTFYYI